MALLETAPMTFNEVKPTREEVLDLFGFNSADSQWDQLFFSKDLRFHILNQQEREREISIILHELNDHKFNKAGAKKAAIWEKGWRENYRAFCKRHSPKDLIPKFYKPDIMRWRDVLIRPVSPSFRYNMWDLLRMLVARKYLKACQHIHEFGAGTFYNLVTFRELFPKVFLHWYEWVPSALQLAAAINKYLGTNMTAHHFDLFHPNKKMNLQPHSAVFTSGTMEQLGVLYHEFVDYLISQRPVIIVHLEPIDEFLQRPGNTLDAISYRFQRERNYLTGFLTYLTYHPKVKIVESHRIMCGNKYNCAWDLVVWKPK